MSRENVEVVRRLYERFGQGDLEGVRNCLHPDVVIDATHRVDARIGHGPDELFEVVGEWLGTWEGWHEEIEDVRSVGERVIVLSTQRGRGKGSGTAWEHRFAMLFEVTDDRISRWTVYDDVDEALEAAGADE